MAMKPTDLETCCGNCAAALRSDRTHGLIYGPYSDGTRQPDGSPTFVSSTIFAALDDSCTYCRAPLPRGRAQRILRRYAPHYLVTPEQAAEATFDSGRVPGRV